MRLFLRFCLWQMKYELTIGNTVGMNPTYLHGLSVAIKDLERDLRLSEINCVH